ncbi:MAG: glycosyltransferase family 9 protein [Bacteroidetes bacterium]|nr:glycosyltransferase family 9 protein [Bacteroidota bacterium]
MSGIGDVLWTTPLLTNLRLAYPDAHIAYVVRSASAFVLENNPDIDEIIRFEDESLRYQLGFLRRLRKRRFDLSIDLICSPATAIHSVVSGARVRIGFDFRLREKLYTHRLSARDANHGHEVEFNLFVLGCMDIPERSRALVWRISYEERARAADDWRALALPDDTPVVALIPTGGFPSKKWPLSHWQRLVQDSRLQHVHFLVFCGNQNERRDAEAIAGVSSRVSVEPKGTLRSSAALMDRCAAAVGNDSGPTHIASALQKPVVVFYGPSNPKSQGPWSDHATVLSIDDVENRCCRRLDCPDPVCMTEISPLRTADALLRALTAGEDAGSRADTDGAQ